MTVGELIELLSQQPLNQKVILSRDPEGNGFHEATGHTENALFQDGEIYNDDDFEEEEDTDEYERVFVLWP